MPAHHPDTNNLAVAIRAQLAMPEHQWHWRELEKLNLPGLEFVGAWRKAELLPGDIVVAATCSRTTAHTALVVGTVDPTVGKFNFCVPIRIKAVLTPRDEAAQSSGLSPGEVFLFGGFQVFRYRGHNQELAT
jgi:hypothetical protein